MEKCKTCIYWAFVYPDGWRKFGTCNNNHVQEQVKVADEVIFTEQLFGCVWYSGKEYVVAKIELPNL